MTRSSMGSSLRAVRWVVGVLGAVVISACSGGGCGALTPIPGGARYAGPKSDNVVNVRLSEAGIGQLNANWKAFIENFAPGQRLDLPINCMIMDMPVLGDMAIADQGSATGTGRTDGKCTSADLPANVAVTVTSFNLKPVSPDVVQVALSLKIDTGRIYLASTGNRGVCAWLSGISCEVELDTARDNPPDALSLDASLKFTIDTRWDKMLSFNITALNGLSVCGSDGALPSPRCLDPDDTFLGGINNCGDIECGLANWGPIKGFILRNVVGPQLDKRVRDALSNVSCEPCGTGKPACPTLPGVSSSCDATRKVCLDGVTGKCVPRFLGIEGELHPATLMSNLGMPDTSSFQLSMGAGSTVTVDKGLTLGTRGGTKTPEPANCVPLVPAPVISTVAAPNFDLEAGGKPYHLGLGMSQQFLNSTLHSAHQGGALCLKLDSSSVSLLNTGAFFLVAPSVTELAKRDGKNAPMMVAFRPKQPPTVILGEGTAASATMTLDFKQLDVDIYAMIDDRFVRLFTLGLDLHLPLSLTPVGCDKVQVVLGDISKLVANLDTSRATSELLPESQAELKGTIDLILGLLDTALSGGSPTFNLPQLAGFQLRLAQAKSIGQSSSGYSHLGIFAQLNPVGSTCLTGGAQIIAQLLDVKGADAQRRWPTVRLAVGSLGDSANTEYAYRVNDGFWTEFHSAPGGTLEVMHPALLLDGRHQISVRAQPAEHPGAISQPVTVEVVLDRMPPFVELKRDRSEDAIRVQAFDNLSVPETLQYAYRVGEGTWSSFGAPRPIHFAAVEAAGGVEVRVRDEAGNVGEASWHASVSAATSLEAGPASEGSGAGRAGGCGSTDNGWLGLAVLVAAGWLWRNDRRRSAR
jgi:hypothetical protein